MRKHYLRFRPMIVLIAVLAAGVLTLRAPQNTGLAGEASGEIVIAGSGYMQQLLQNLVDDYQATNTSDATFRVGSEGSGPGFDLLCSNEADATMSTQSITDAQVLRCNENAVDFVELVLAIDHAVLVADADAEFACLNEADITGIFRRAGELTLADVLPSSESSEVVTVYGPSDTNSAYTFLRAALLNDLDPSIDETFVDAADISDTLGDAGNSAIAVMTLGDFEALANDDLQLVSVRPASGGDCVSPSSVSLSTGDYPVSRMLMLYANAASIVDSELGALLRYGIGAPDSENRPLVTAANTLGFAAPDTAVLDRNNNNVEGPLTGRTFTRTDSPTLVNTAVEGSLTINGASISTFATSTFFNSFNSTYVGAELILATFGDDAAWEAFCNGEVSVIQVSRPATEAELANCRVTPIEFYLGADAVVLLTAADSPLPMCLSNEQIAAILGQLVAAVPADVTDDSIAPEAAAEATEIATEVATEAATEAAPEATETPDTADDINAPDSTPPVVAGPTMWSEIAPDWAADNDDLPLLVLVPTIGDLDTDIILSVTGVVPNFRRTDAPTIQETPSAAGLSDIEYRLGATAITPGAITYVRWSEYQTASTRFDLRYVQIGDNCSEPNVDSLQDGSYPFSMSARLVFAQENLTTPLVADLLWHVVNRDALAALESLNLVGFDRLGIEAQRDAIFTLLEAASQTPADDTVSPDATEVVPDATTESTVAPTETATETATEAPTSAPTLEPTEAPTTEPTNNPTEVPTEEPTPEATDTAE